MIEVTFKVRFYETDMMQVVHHSNHLRWFELGRVEYLRNAGITLLDLIAKEGIVCPIKNVSCEYKEPARFDDFIVLETRMKKMSRAQVTFAYVMRRKSDGVLIAEGTTQNVFTYQESGKVARLSDAYYGPLAAYAKEDLRK